MTVSEFGAPQGYLMLAKAFMRPVVWGPHFVRGAQPEAERLSK
jgi:hypothetical protein